MKKPKTSLQTHGLQSKVYVPILRDIFARAYRPGIEQIPFTLDDLRHTADRLGLRDALRNVADLVYRMRSRTVLPEEMRALGFHILRQVGRGRYVLEKGESPIVPLPEAPTLVEAIDITPLPVRRLLPEDVGEIDEQGLLTLVNYCKLLDDFTGLTVYRLRSHVRKSVAGVGQAEVDEVDVGVALREDEIPVVFPIEAKTADDEISRVQVTMQVMFAQQYFAGHTIRPLAIKADPRGDIHMFEFAVETSPSALVVLRQRSYRLRLSPERLAVIRQGGTR